VQQRQSFGSIKVNTPAVARGQRIGIMGGSFNPPHAGHYRVADTAIKRLGLDRLWWVVTPGNPLKSNGQLPNQAERMALIEALCRKLGANPRMVVTGFEAELGSPFTAVTIAFLQRRHPGVQFVWVMGADNMASFHRWQNWRGIASALPLAVIDRPGWRLKALSSPAAQFLARFRLPEARGGALFEHDRPAWTLLSTRLSTLSSTELRDKPLLKPNKMK
jgi:nicotinate-nucleotide adenylyltransferase